MRGLHRVLNMPQNALIVAQYVWLCLNNAEYHWICRHIPEKIENWICQNSDAVQSIRSLYQLQSRAVIVTKTYLEHCQTTFKMDRFTKKIACVQVGNQKFFRATKKKKRKQKNWGWNYLIRQIFRRQKEAPQETIFEFFILDTLKTYTCYFFKLTCYNLKAIWLPIVYS